MAAPVAAAAPPRGGGLGHAREKAEAFPQCRIGRAAEEKPSSGQGDPSLVGIGASDQPDSLKASLCASGACPAGRLPRCEKINESRGLDCNVSAASLPALREGSAFSARAPTPPVPAATPPS